MKIPVVYELNGRRRCLLVQDGETISVGRAETCSLRVDAEGVQEVELTAQFVNGCHLVVVHPGNGSVPYAQPLPWKLKLGGFELQLFPPFKPGPGEAARELVVQGLSAGETRLVLPPDRPLRLGSGQDCDVVMPDAGCPEVLLALWAAAGGKVLVQLLDDSAVVGWLGRAGEAEAELELPLSLSIGGRVLLIRSGGAAALPQAVAKLLVTAPAPVARVAAILPKGAEAEPKIIARNPAERTGKAIMQAPAIARVPIALARPKGVAAQEDFPLLAEEALKAPKPYSPTFFLLSSWLLVGLMFAVALLPGQGVLTPEQLVQLWYAAGGTLILTLLLGMGVLLK